MAILRSNGILEVSSIPAHTPINNQATLARLTDTNTFYYWDGASWITLIIGDDTAYDATSWNGSLDVPTKNAIRDAIEALALGSIPDGDKGDITTSASGATWTIDNGLAATKIADGSVSNTEFQYLGGVTSDIQAQLDSKAVDTEVIHDTGNEVVAGIKTFTDGIETLDDPYDATSWNGNDEVPTKNAIRDKIESMTTSANVADGDYGAITVTGGVWALDPLVDATLIADGSVTNTEFQYISTLTSNAQTQINAKADDTSVVHDTGDEAIAGVKTFSSDPIIPDEVYGVGWNGSLEPPTKNALYDKIETIAVHNPLYVFKANIAQTGVSTPTLGDVQINTLGEVPTLVYTGVGDYEVNVVGGQFVAAKTRVIISLQPSATAFLHKEGIGATVNEVVFKTFDAAGAPIDLEGSLSITIEVYP